MKIRNTLPHVMAILFLIIALASCQEDFSTLGSDIIGGQSINSISNNSSTVIAYSRKLEPVQTNNLPLYQLGSYIDPVFGKSNFGLVSQLILGTTDPDFGYGTHLDSVVLYMPYLSESTVTDDVTTYTIDSVYGTSPINIKIYESNYYLRAYDPTTGLQERQKYYSNLGSVFETPSNLGPLLYEVENFIPDNEGYVLLSPDGTDEGTEADITLAAPGLRVKLPVSFFMSKIISQAGSTHLMNNNNFKEYFRGLYFNIDDMGSDGNIFLFDIAQASVKLYYSYQETPVEIIISDPDDVERLTGELTLSLSGINVNLFDNEQLPTGIDNSVTTPNTSEGEELLYVRGGEGIVTLINLFGDEDADNNGVSDELDVMRQEQWLINEANLVFYVDQDKVTGGAAEPERIIIYDTKNLTVLADYGFDPTISQPASEALTEHLGRLQRGSDENGEYYKIRVTHHISNLIHKDSTNVPLALIVTQNVLTGGFQSLKNPFELNNDELKSVPSASVISHQGTVLFGNNTTNEEKQLKLQIYYTKPD